MLIGFDPGSYLVCMFLAFSFVMMIAGFHAESGEGYRVAANIALVLSGAYAVLVLLVYFAQMTIEFDSESSTALMLPAGKDSGKTKMKLEAGRASIRSKDEST